MKNFFTNSEFSIISESKVIPVEVTLSLTKSVRKQLLKEISFYGYIREKINIQGNDGHNYSGIDTSENELVLDYICSEISRGHLRPAADFILCWGDSSKLIIRKRQDLLNIFFIVYQFCFMEKRSVSSFSRVLYFQFEEMLNSFNKCFKEIRVIFE